MIRKQINLRLSITKSKREWNAADAIVKEMGRAGIRSYVLGEVQKLSKAIEDGTFVEIPMPVSSDNTIIEQIPLNENEHKNLRALADKMQRPLTCIIDAIVFEPLFKK